MHPAGFPSAFLLPLSVSSALPSIPSIPIHPSHTHPLASHPSFCPPTCFQKRLHVKEAAFRAVSWGEGGSVLLTFLLCLCHTLVCGARCPAIGRLVGWFVSSQFQLSSLIHHIEVCRPVVSTPPLEQVSWPSASFPPHCSHYQLVPGFRHGSVTGLTSQMLSALHRLLPHLTSGTVQTPFLGIRSPSWPGSLPLSPFLHPPAATENPRVWLLCLFCLL